MSHEGVLEGMSSNKDGLFTKTYYGETSVKTKETVFIWTIRNASNCYRSAGTSCASPSFNADLNRIPTRWMLYYFPNGCDADYESWASLELFEQAYSSNENLELYIKISVIDASKIESVKYANFISLTDEDSQVLTVGKFIRNTDVPKFFANGNLTIVCRLYEPIEINHSSITSNLCKFIDNSEASIVNDFEKLLNNAKLSDVKLKTNDEEFFAHKAILSARSRVFEAMFEHDMKESTDNVVSIIDIDGDTVKEMLRFIYVGKVLNLDSIVDKLLIAADKYELNGLKVMCENAMMASLSSKTIKDILQLVDRYDTQKLRDSTIEFISMHAKELSVDEGFNAGIKNLSPSLLALVIKALMSRG